ncbi:hypothetical protein AB4Z30_28755 [Paenibacillus sp. 2TAF8]|uniref:hypothetical protein n=1 Tax=Paenibacillus sp. 2TAF8 TaxID=3233020 RepID=UPI003F94751C
MFDKLRQIKENIMDRAASAVQTFTGEKERRENVTRFKEIHDSFKQKLEMIVSRINTEIGKFNQKIEFLNKYRNSKVKENILLLGVFLSKFGNIKTINRFSAETGQDNINFSSKGLETVDDYIQKIDWSKEDIFTKTFFKGPIGMRRETKKLNLETTQRMEEFMMDGNRMLNIGEIKLEYMKEDIQILDLYQESVEFISETIHSTIVPELELVQALLQCEEIKNQVLANREISVSVETDVGIFAKGLYHKHYHFVKNSLLFFVISSKIYDTPVITNLLNGDQHKKEREVVINYNQVLNEQQKQIEQYKI